MYKLCSATVGVVADRGKRIAITMPAEAEIDVARENPGEGTVEVIWDGRWITMFAIDLKERGRPIRRNGTANGSSPNPPAAFRTAS